jgi:hypothetical protein
MQLVGLKEIRVGEPLTRGVKAPESTTGAKDSAEELIKAFKKVKQPFQGGITFNFSNPTSQKYYREGQADPFFAIKDPTSGSKELSWNVADFDDDTLTFYFGTKSPEVGRLYEGRKAFVFVAESGSSLAFANLKYAASLTGGMNTGAPAQIAVTAEVLTPDDGGYSWWPIATPTFTGEDWKASDATDDKA